MKKVLFITFLSFFVFLTSGYSKSKITKDSTVTNVTSWGKNKIGVTYSMMTGSGMSYWREINEKFAFKTQIFGYGTTEVENKYDNSIIASFGLELQFQLNKTERTKLYLLSGAYYSYNNEMNYYYRRKFIDDYKEYLSNFGAGFGFEVLALKNLSFSIDGGYFIGFKNVREYYENEDLTIYKNPFSFGFGLGISAFYNL